MLAFEPPRLCNQPTNHLTSRIAAASTPMDALQANFDAYTTHAMQAREAGAQVRASVGCGTSAG